MTNKAKLGQGTESNPYYPCQFRLEISQFLLPVLFNYAIDGSLIHYFSFSTTKSSIKFTRTTACSNNPNRLITSNTLSKTMTMPT